tara:strand:- start:1619 stop:2926 length:1308 start_codon:yes stop_codon:yes gene_type:complete
MEMASKSSHGHIIRDPEVQKFLAQCELPKEIGEIELPSTLLFDFEAPTENPIKHIITIDGGYTEVAVRNQFPSSTMCFFQFGALVFSLEDLREIEQSKFIDPADMARLKNIQRLKLALPVRHIKVGDEATLTHSVRRALWDFFTQDIDGTCLADTLRWLVFEEFLPTASSQWKLASCPHCGARNVSLQRTEMVTNNTANCPACSKSISITDVFRLHEAVDDELGAGGILGYVTTAIEQIILAHMIRLVLQSKPDVLKQLLFIKDGPLGFFGQTANLHKPMRRLITYLFATHNLYLVGLEKSGSFVEHAHEARELLESGQFHLLDDQYIYRYILPGKAPQEAYGSTSYYGNKMVFRDRRGGTHVVTVAATTRKKNVTLADFKNLPELLLNIELLRCDMYDNALMPVALANKLVSLANHPSSKILQKFAIGGVATGS